MPGVFLHTVLCVSKGGSRREKARSEKRCDCLWLCVQYLPFAAVTILVDIIRLAAFKPAHAYAFLVLLKVLEMGVKVRPKGLLLRVLGGWDWCALRDLMVDRNEVCCAGCCGVLWVSGVFGCVGVR